MLLQLLVSLPAIITNYVDKNDKLFEKITHLQKQLLNETDKDDYFAFMQAISTSERDTNCILQNS